MGFTKIEESSLLPGRKLLVGLAVVLAMVAVPLTAHAGAHAGTKENKERAAKTACLAGDYAKGVALLAELYVSTNDVTYLFNQGRCFEQNGKYEEAIVRFREYQQKRADAGAPPDSTAETHIEKCQALLDKQKPSQGTAVVLAATPTVSAVVPEKAAVAEQVAPKPVVEAKPEVASEPKVEIAETTAPAAPGGALRIVGITAAAVGVVGIATGVVLNLKANSLTKDLEAANGSSTMLYSRSKESSRSSYQTLGWVAYGAGAAFLVGGAVLYWLGHSEEQTQVAFVPALGAGEIGAALQGAF
jgi:hypothetical protein